MTTKKQYREKVLTNNKQITASYKVRVARLAESDETARIQAGVREKRKIREDKQRINHETQANKRRVLADILDCNKADKAKKKKR